METTGVKKLRASTSARARQYRQQGHDDALHFALAIGLGKDYKNDPLAKKDVIDPSGDAHSVKSGEKKWQVFLYGRSRFENDALFRVMNGVGQLLVDCINSFPAKFQEYQNNKLDSKNKLRPYMVAIANKLQDKDRLRAFLEKSIFNGGEVNYLTVYDKGKFHIFWGKEVSLLMSENLVVANSQALHKGQFPEQKVVFKFNGTTLAELEMRNDSVLHYREIRFNMLKPKAMALLYSKINTKKNFNDEVVLHGDAIRHFGHWE
jgi:hypothetical protein